MGEQEHPLNRIADALERMLAALERLSALPEEKDEENPA